MNPFLLAGAHCCCSSQKMPVDRKKVSLWLFVMDWGLIRTHLKESAAIQIQHWWRIHLKQHEKLAEKTRRMWASMYRHPYDVTWSTMYIVGLESASFSIEWRGMQDISLHNTELIERLKVIRRQKVMRCTSARIHRAITETWIIYLSVQSPNCSNIFNHLRCAMTIAIKTYS